MKESKTVLSVILGVAIVALVSAIVAVAIDAFILLIDYSELYGDETDAIIVGVAELIAVCFAVAFAVVALMRKNSKDLLIFTIVAAAYFVITAIVLRFVVPYSSDDGSLSTGKYSLFMSYLTNVAGLMVSLIVTAVSALLLIRMKSKQAAENAETKPNGAEQTENNSVSE